MRLHDLLDATEVLEFVHDASVDVNDVTHDSRSTHPGALFCCISGEVADGHEFAAGAVAAGAVAVMVERPVAVTVPQARVASVRRSLGPVAARVHGDPSRHVDVIGITGTNGKTTTAFLLGGILRAAARRPAVLGTLGVHFDGETHPAMFTTPEAPDLQRLLASLRAQGAASIVMEVSSHALSEHRVDATMFAAVCFTNVSHDHLDYHGTMDDYVAAKAALFRSEFSRRAAINIDDGVGPELVTRARGDQLDVVTFGIDAPAADVRAADLVGDVTSTMFRLYVDGDGVDLRLELPGRFNVENALAAAATAHALGIDPATIASGLVGLRAVPGRFEPIDSSAPVTVIVDYAHTPAGIATVLATARAVTAGRVIAVFGCGGDRDAAKRAAMGAAAGNGADLVVLTSDNPRSEDPAVIAEAAAVGLRNVGAEFAVELDRRRAIRDAVRAAVPGDVVLVLGKGAETGQRVGDRVVPFDDRIVAAEELESAWS